jgi:hypothetical protein
MRPIRQSSGPKLDIRRSGTHGAGETIGGSATRKQEDDLCGSDDLPGGLDYRPQDSGTEPLTIDSPELAFFEWIVGPWDVLYPGPDDLICPDYVEHLEFKRDGTVAWDPAPNWAMPGGKFGVNETGGGLYFQRRNSRLMKGHHLVVVEVPVGHHSHVTLHWQRRYSHAVVFHDRVFMARRPKGWLPAVDP